MVIKLNFLKTMENKITALKILALKARIFYLYKTERLSEEKTAF